MIRAISVDAAFANMGLASVVIRKDASVSGYRFPGSFSIDCVELKLVTTSAQAGKVVRKSSDDLRRAVELHRALHSFIQKHDAQVVFAEIPTGAQSAAAAKYLGAALGILASIPIPIVQVSPLEVKAAVAGAKSAQVSKQKVIAWAVKLWPLADWVRYEKAGKVNGKGGKVLATWKAGELKKENEHLADALGIAAAGVQTPAFQQLMALHHATTGTSGQRSSSRRIACD
jgi:Holliday junction resolvasome RuvABC endonuclease subunit